MTVAGNPDFALSLPSPLGTLTLAEREGAVVALSWGTAGEARETALLRRAARLLEQYFKGGPVAFDLPLDPAGTAFERRVWAALGRIPWGETQTYGEIAGITGSSPRAVGRAVGRNPIPIIIPCHRVLARDGLGGYSAPGGVATKRELLRLEGGRVEDDLLAGADRNSVNGKRGKVVA